LEGVFVAVVFVSYSDLTIFSEIVKMNSTHEEYLAWVLAQERGITVAEVLRVAHLKPDPRYQGLTYPAKPPANHLWTTDSLRWWLQEEGCAREGLEMWLLRRRRGTVKIIHKSEQVIQNSSSSQVAYGPSARSVMEEEKRKLNKRRRALHSHKLPKGR
jgi:hypothetical protein